MAESTPTLAACLSAAALRFSSDSARLDAEVMLAYVLNKSRTYLFTWPEKTLSATEQTLWQRCVERRANGEPVAHIVGKREFWTLDLAVDNSTLIPRPETELLVETALEKCFAEAHILDLGTGTGALALALASEIPSMQVDAVDVHANAVALAQKNAQRNGLARVNIFQSHWFDHVSGLYDIIVSNPPYIEADDPHLQQGDVRFEPKSALVSGTDGLDDIRHICKQSVNYLHDDGWLMLEHGWRQAENVQAILVQNKFTNVATLNDYAGNPRVTIGQFI